MVGSAYFYISTETGGSLSHLRLIVIYLNFCNNNLINYSYNLEIILKFAYS